VRARLILGLRACPYVLAAAVVGCGGGSAVDNAQTDRTHLRIYSSLPLRGPGAAQSRSIVNGEKLALAQERGRIGRFKISYSSLDDTTPAVQTADPGQTSANARKASQDPATIAYLGEGEGGASAISIPILNEAGIVEVSPADSVAGLTRQEGADQGEPQKYYPSGKRTFVRVVPANHVQAAALAALMLDKGCTQTFLIRPSTVFGRDLASQLHLATKTDGPTIVRDQRLPPGAKDFRGVAEKVRTSGTDCMLFSGLTADGAAELFEQVHAAAPRVKLFGSSGVAESSFTTALSPAVQRVTYLTSPGDPHLFPPAGKTFYATYREKFGEEPEPAAIFGYEAMKLTLLAIQNAGDQGNDRRAVSDAIFKIKDHDSPLGRYSIDANGDTTLDSYAAETVRNGRLTFDRTLRTGSDE
jgi:branched-chain amino acid transport system substrate-binding protein